MSSHERFIERAEYAEERSAELRKRGSRLWVREAASAKYYRDLAAFAKAKE